VTDNRIQWTANLGNVGEVATWYGNLVLTAESSDIADALAHLLDELSYANHYGADDGYADLEQLDNILVSYRDLAAKVVTK